MFIAAGIYVGISIAVALWSTYGCPESRQQLQQLPTGRRAYAVFLTCVLSVVIMPVVVWAVLRALWEGWQEYRRESKQFKWLLGNHRDYIFEPLHSANLPADTESVFDEQTEELTQLNFELIGDYLLKGDPCQVIGRLFLNTDGRVFASLTRILDCHAFSFLSVFSDGVPADTSSVEHNGRIPDLIARGNFIGWSAADHTIAEALTLHLQKTSNSSPDHGELISYHPEDWQTVYHYINRLWGSEMHALGEYNERPEVPPVPRGNAAEDQCGSAAKEPCSHTAPESARTGCSITNIEN